MSTELTKITSNELALLLKNHCDTIEHNLLDFLRTVVVQYVPAISPILNQNLIVQNDNDVFIGIRNILRINNIGDKEVNCSLEILQYCKDYYHPTNCIICQSKRAILGNEPCCHLFMCEDCHNEQSMMLTECPLCRTQIANIKQFHNFPELDMTEMTEPIDVHQYIKLCIVETSCARCFGKATDFCVNSECNNKQHICDNCQTNNNTCSACHSNRKRIYT